jgi:hypothetical protein
MEGTIDGIDEDLLDLHFQNHRNKYRAKATVKANQLKLKRV